MLIWAVLYLFYWNDHESEEWTEKYIYIVSYSSRNNNTTREKFKWHKIILNSKGDKSGKKLGGFTNFACCSLFNLPYGTCSKSDRHKY